MGEDANVGDSRPGVVIDGTSERSFFAFAGPSIGGDSGSPIIDGDGLAVAPLTTGGLPYVSGYNGATNLAHSLVRFEEYTRRSVDLQTWPTFEVPRVEPVMPDARQADESVRQ